MTTFGYIGAMTLLLVLCMTVLLYMQGEKQDAMWLSRDLLFFTILLVGVGVTWPMVCWISGI